MRHWVRAAAAGAAMLLAAIPAYADWPPVRWGMSLDQVLAAMPGGDAGRRGAPMARRKERRLGPADARRSAAQDGDILLKAEFYFGARSKKLAFVRLVATDPKQCAAWRANLVARNGEGKLTSRNEIGKMDTTRWTDRDGDALLFLYIEMPNNAPYHCHLLDGVPSDLNG